MTCADDLKALINSALNSVAKAVVLVDETRVNDPGDADHQVMLDAVEAMCKEAQQILTSCDEYIATAEGDD